MTIEAFNEKKKRRKKLMNIRTIQYEKELYIYWKKKKKIMLSFFIFKRVRLQTETKSRLREPILCWHKHSFFS